MPFKAAILGHMTSKLFSSLVPMPSSLLYNEKTKGEENDDEMYKSIKFHMVIHDITLLNIFNLINSLRLMKTGLISAEESNVH